VKDSWKDNLAQLATVLLERESFGWFTDMGFLLLIVRDIRIAQSQQTKLKCRRLIDWINLTDLEGRELVSLFFSRLMSYILYMQKGTSAYSYLFSIFIPIQLFSLSLLTQQLPFYSSFAYSKQK
jgi:hypothetical protein